MIKNFKYIGASEEDKNVMDRITKSFGDENIDKFTQKKTFSPSTIVFSHGSCFSAETEFVTRDGIKTMVESVGQPVEVWTGGPHGKSKDWQGHGWKRATVEHFGKQEIYELTVQRSRIKQVIRTTKDHRWMVVSDERYQNKNNRYSPEIVTTENLNEKDHLWQNNTKKSTRLMSHDGVRHGFVFGDGNRPGKKTLSQGWSVVSVVPTGKYEDVYCVVEPETESFTLANGIITKNCPRYWWYAFTGTQWKDSNSHVNLAKMNTGTFRHEKLQADLEAAFGDDIEIERNLRNEDPPINSYCDAVVHDKSRLVPIEIKTVGDMAFSYRKTTGKPAEYNITQILIYMYLLDSDTGILLYEHRDTFEKLMIPVKMTPEYREYIEYLFGWMRETYSAFDNDEKPKYFKNRRSNSRICKTCPVKETCDADGNDGIIDLPLLRSINK